MIRFPVVSKPGFQMNTITNIFLKNATAMEPVCFVRINNTLNAVGPSRRNLSWNKNHGFTLLEVMVALTITGFILGGLFSLVGGSKQLSWKSKESLYRAVHARAAINFALLEDDYSDIESVLEGDYFDIQGNDILEPPERKTQASAYALQEYEVINNDTDEAIIGVRWIRLELPE